MPWTMLLMAVEFLSTPSARRATHGRHSDIGQRCISIHALREEGDVSVDSGPSFASEFLSTPSARRATFCFHLQFEIEAISIHALREEGDMPCATIARHDVYFYPRPPRGGRQYMAKWAKKFF